MNDPLMCHFQQRHFDNVVPLMACSVFSTFCSFHSGATLCLKFEQHNVIIMEMFSPELSRLVFSGETDPSHIIVICYHFMLLKLHFMFFSFPQSVLPFFVATKMTRIRKPTLDKPTPERYVAAELNTVGLQSQTNGYFPHAVMVRSSNLTSVAYVGVSSI